MKKYIYVFFLTFLGLLQGAMASRHVIEKEEKDEDTTFSPERLEREKIESWTVLGMTRSDFNVKDVLSFRQKNPLDARVNAVSALPDCRLKASIAGRYDLHKRLEIESGATSSLYPLQVRMKETPVILSKKIMDSFSVVPKAKRFHAAYEIYLEKYQDPFLAEFFAGREVYGSFQKAAEAARAEEEFWRRPKFSGEHKTLRGEVCSWSVEGTNKANEKTFIGILKQSKSNIEDSNFFERAVKEIGFVERIKGTEASSGPSIGSSSSFKSSSMKGSSFTPRESKVSSSTSSFSSSEKNSEKKKKFQIEPEEDTPSWIGSSSGWPTEVRVEMITIPISRPPMPVSSPSSSLLDLNPKDPVRLGRSAEKPAAFSEEASEIFLTDKQVEGMSDEQLLELARKASLKEKKRLLGVDPDIEEEDEEPRTVIIKRAEEVEEKGRKVETPKPAAKAPEKKPDLGYTTTTTRTTTSYTYTWDEEQKIKTDLKLRSKKVTDDWNSFSEKWRTYKKNATKDIQPAELEKGFERIREEAQAIVDHPMQDLDGTLKGTTELIVGLCEETIKEIRAKNGGKSYLQNAYAEREKELENNAAMRSLMIMGKMDNLVWDRVGSQQQLEELKKEIQEEVKRLNSLQDKHDRTQRQRSYGSFIDDIDAKLRGLQREKENNMLREIQAAEERERKRKEEEEAASLAEALRLQEEEEAQNRHLKSHEDLARQLEADAELARRLAAGEEIDLDDAGDPAPAVIVPQPQPEPKKIVEATPMPVEKKAETPKPAHKVIQLEEEDELNPKVVNEAIKLWENYNNSVKQSIQIKSLDGITTLTKLEDEIYTYEERTLSAAATSEGRSVKEYVEAHKQDENYPDVQEYLRLKKAEETVQTAIKMATSKEAYTNYFTKELVKKGKLKANQLEKLFETINLTFDD